MTNKPDFESALKRLEDIVAMLESSDIKLDEMLKIYEEGARLIKQCLSDLDKAEEKIQVLNADAEKADNQDKEI